MTDCCIVSLPLGVWTKRAVGWKNNSVGGKGGSSDRGRLSAGGLGGQDGAALWVVEVTIRKVTRLVGRLGEAE